MAQRIYSDSRFPCVSFISSIESFSTSLEFINIEEYHINISETYSLDYTKEETLMKTKILAVLMVLVMVASVFTVAAGDSSSSGLDAKTEAREGRNSCPIQYDIF